jgi:ABC-type nitrate/sulfonate/bicarbonate transport system substrate-binding protein
MDESSIGGRMRAPRHIAVRLTALVAALLAALLVAACAPASAPPAAKPAAAPAASNAPSPASAASGGAAAAAPTAASNEPAMVPIKISYTVPGGIYTPLYVADTEGVFRKHGLDVELILGGTGARTALAMIG